MNYDQEFKISQRTYLETLPESLDELEVLILGLADPAARQSVQRRLMRLLHSIKGSSGTYELEAIKSLAHRMEDQVSSSSTEDKDAVTLIEVLLDGKDQMLKLKTAYAADDTKSLSLLMEQIGFLSSEARPESLAPRGGRAQKFRVLLAESTTTIASRCKAALKGTGAEVTWAKNGHEALGIALNERFDAVITSAVMPAIDGVNLRKILFLLGSPNHSAAYFMLTSEPEPLRALVEKDVVILEKSEKLTSALKDHFETLLAEAGIKAPDASEEEKKDVAKILLVDDAADIQKLVVLSFKKFPKVQIDAFTNPLEALRIGAAGNFDAAVLDMQMPEMDGLALMEKLRQSPGWKDRPIFFLTGTEDPIQTVGLLRKGAAGIFKKPFSPKTFAGQLMNALSEIRRNPC